MEYDVNKLPDFYSVRNLEQIDYSLEDLEGKKCYAFFDNGFTSNIIEGNKRDMRFVWDGFLLFVDQSINLDDIRNGVDLFDSRLVALQRTNLLRKKLNNSHIREYIEKKLEEQDIPLYKMEDKKEVDGYALKSDLWSTRDEAVLIDATECVGEGDAYYFTDSSFYFRITFPDSNLPDFDYQHKGTLVLKGENSTAISRLILNDSNLQKHLETLVGEEKLYSFLEGRELSGTSIHHVKSGIRK